MNPFTKQESTASLDQLFDQAKARVGAAFALFDTDEFTSEAAHVITGGLNFSGNHLPGETAE